MATNQWEIIRNDLNKSDRRAEGNNMKHVIAASVLFAALLASGSAMSEAERIGQATRIQTTVNGDYGELAVKEPVHRNEKIRTSKSGLGEFLFRDGTKFAVGQGSDVKIDKFVFDDADSSSLEKLSIKVSKGTFRWISGASKSKAYEIHTPVGTIGVRGTKFDFYVGADGTTAVVLLSGRAQFCGAGGCVQLQRRCDCVIAKRGQRPSLSRASRQTLATLGNKQALPFLSGNQKLSGAFGQSTGCNMATASLEQTNPGRDKPSREKPSREKSTADKPTGRSGTAGGNKAGPGSTGGKTRSGGSGTTGGAQGGDGNSGTGGGGTPGGQSAGGTGGGTGGGGGSGGGGPGNGNGNNPNSGNGGGNTNGNGPGTGNGGQNNGNGGTGGGGGNPGGDAPGGGNAGGGGPGNGNGNNPNSGNGGGNTNGDGPGSGNGGQNNGGAGGNAGGGGAGNRGGSSHGGGSGN